MAIADSCYIRNIQKAEQTLLKKADVKFSLNTTSSILMRVLIEFFPNQITIEKQSENIQKLARELADFKKQVCEVCQIGAELKTKRDQLFKVL